MKTLTQHFIEQYTKNYGNKSDAQWDAEKKAVEAWLTERQKEYEKQKGNQYRNVYDDLLEELKQK